METQSKNLIVIGDPIKDCYITTEGNRTTSYEERDGGALNVYSNAVNLLKPQKIIFYPNVYDNNYYKILRIDNQKDIAMYPSHSKTNFYQFNLSKRIIESLSLSHSPESALVLSDYNKGILNTRINLSVSPYFKYSVIDTRYRSINLNYLKLSKINIWRCTGKEYESEFATNFDYIIWTDAEKPIKILNRKQEIINIIEYTPASEEKVIDTCGAGDTFTATVASFLFKKKRIDLESITDACNYAVVCCQEIIQYPKTSVIPQKFNLHKRK
jgi:bifunctional ADP-heptose synthase (sugar kinase/adenylyltransferase)